MNNSSKTIVTKLTFADFPINFLHAVNKFVQSTKVKCKSICLNLSGVLEMTVILVCIDSSE